MTTFSARVAYLEAGTQNPMLPDAHSPSYRWYGDPINPFSRTPLFPGEDAGDKCVYRYQGVVLTTDSRHCEVVWDPSKQASPLPGSGWKKGSWIMDNLWFREGGRCDGNYDDWYAGFPSTNNSLVDYGSLDKTNMTESDVFLYQTQYSRVIGETADYFIRDVLRCGRSDGSFHDEGHRYGSDFTDHSVPSPSWHVDGVPGDSPRSIPLIYCGLLDRGEDKTSVSWVTATSAAPGLVNQIFIEGITQLVASFTGVYLHPPATSSASPSATPTVNNQNTQESDLVVSAPRPPQPENPAFTPNLVAVPITKTLTAASTFTTSGHLTTSRYTTEVHTTILANLPPLMVPPSRIVQTNSLGQLTTSTNFFGDPILKTVPTTFTDIAGSPIATGLVTVPITSIVRVYTAPNGVPTTVTEFPVYPHIPGSQPAKIVVAKTASYFVVYFFPIALTLLVLIPIQAIDTEVKLLLPFRLLARDSVTTDAMCMRTGGLTGRLNGWRLLWTHGDPISAVSDLLVVCAATLVVLSGETAGLKLRGTCVKQNMRTCLVTVAAFPTPARAAEALLGLLMVLILLLWIPETKEVFRRLRVDPQGQGKESLDVQLTERFGNVGFKLGWAASGSRANDYGLLAPCQGHSGFRVAKETHVHRADTGADTGAGPGEKMTFRVEAGERVFQGVFLFVLCGLLTLVVYYESVEFKDPSLSPFESFMDSQSFGVIMLFTAIGELIVFAWDHLFSNFTKKIVLLQMAQKPQPATLSVLKSRPTNVFAGLGYSIRDRDVLGVTMCFAGLLSKFLPALLSGIPFQAAQTYQTHEICTWSSIAILIVMILVLIHHMWRVKWPNIPASPDLLAGWAYYVCDSRMLRDFERLSMLSRRERDLRVERMGRRYHFGWIRGVSGEWRMGIDYAEGEQGYKMKSLGALGFGVGGRIKGR
ncbi:hypothetical protein QBC34DRAFT_498966 [Podospora aff. communis PSN243]|uniref:Uncharacterized protein n=1 Tax=Podospora aff. communis PSN243 TaxID=3040156 RepID=A0AAV9G639_9PEZI|nr:hypothetical protein QBC34DRAFT_498966 [Podospora aff. communis PSN243]